MRKCLGASLRFSEDDNIEGDEDNEIRTTQLLIVSFISIWTEKLLALLLLFGPNRKRNR